MRIFTLTFFVLALGCGGGASATPATSGGEAPSGPRLVGACHTASLGVCQRYYEGDSGLAEAQSACTQSDVPGTSGEWLADCPSGNRIGDCADVNGNVQARFYSGSTQYPDAESAENACEADSGTWVP